MKKLLVMVAAVVAGYAAVAAAVEFLGIEVGGTLNVLDAKVREREGLGAPTLENMQMFFDTTKSFVPSKIQTPMSFASAQTPTSLSTRGTPGSCRYSQVANDFSKLLNATRRLRENRGLRARCACTAVRSHSKSQVER